MAEELRPKTGEELNKEAAELKRILEEATRKQAEAIKAVEKLSGQRGQREARTRSATAQVKPEPVSLTSPTTLPNEDTANQSDSQINLSDKNKKPGDKKLQERIKEEEKQAALAGLRKTIEDTRKALEESREERIKEEVLVKALREELAGFGKKPEITPEPPKKEDNTDTKKETSVMPSDNIALEIEDMQSELNLLNMELKRSPGLRKILKRRFLISQIKELTEKINKKIKLLEETKTAESKEYENREEIKRDRKERPLLYFAAKKNSNPYIYAGFMGENADMRLVVLPADDKHYGRKYESLQKTGENEGYFFFNFWGFVMIIKNVKEIEGKDGIRIYSDQAIYKIVGPNGEIVADDVQSYNKAKKIYDEAIEGYQTEQVALFEKQNKK